jgi:hypothetical protein
MKFDLIYNSLKPLIGFECEIFEGDKDYLNAYISKIQEVLEVSNNVQFNLECLGEDWKTMIFYDFSLFTEHLQDLNQLCYNRVGESYQMWYHEQGIDRKIQFTKVDSETIKIENVSGATWISPLQFENIKVEDLKNEIINFVNKIKEAVEIVYPELNNLEMLQQWYKSFEH